MKKLLIAVGVVVAISASALLPSTAIHANRLASTTSITISGAVTDKGQRVAGRVIVAWCGDINHFGGTDTTDASGHFIIQTNSDDCPLGAQMSVVAYNQVDASVVDGFSLVTVQPKTAVNIAIGTSTQIPEYGWTTGTVSAMAAVGIFAIVRRHFT